MDGVAPDLGQDCPVEGKTSAAQYATRKMSAFMLLTYAGRQSRQMADDDIHQLIGDFVLAYIAEVLFNRIQLLIYGLLGLLH